MTIILPTRRALNPNKLLRSKWTAVTPRNKEKHFIVIKVIAPEPPSIQIETIELEAVHSRRSFCMPWRDLAGSSNWLQGWF